MKKAYLFLILGFLLIASGASTYLYDVKVKGTEAKSATRKESSATKNSHLEHSEQRSDKSPKHDRKSPEDEEKSHEDAGDGAHQDSHSDVEGEDTATLVERAG